MLSTVMFPQLSLLLKLLLQLRFEFRRDDKVSVSGDDRYNCPRSEPLHVVLSLLEESNRRRDLRRLVRRRRIDFDAGCSVGGVVEDEDFDGGNNGCSSLSMFSAMFQIRLLYSSALLLPFWSAACRAENGDGGSAVIMIICIVDDKTTTRCRSHSRNY